MPQPPAPAPTTWPGPRDAPDPKKQPLLADANIQGNVLAGFNKDHQVLLFVRWPSDAVGREWLNELLPRIARNDAVAAFNKRFSLARQQGGQDPRDMAATWINVSLTVNGVQLLDPAAIAELSSSGAPDQALQAWMSGAASTAQLLGDASPESWLFGGPTTEPHAVLCLATDRPADLQLELTAQHERATRMGVEVLFEQPGATLPGVSAGHEHFGFKDGISQPGVSGFDKPNPHKTSEVDGKAGTDIVAAGNFILGYPRDDGSAVRVPAWMFDGSFLVTRRLAQDVPGFWSGVQQQFDQVPEGVRKDAATGIPSADALAARLVGRWRSGTPTDHAVVADNRSAQDPGRDNDFDFAGDEAGLKTPACAHIRKLYPRQGASQATPPVSEDDTRPRRIIRRGIPFGLPFLPTGGRGEGVDSKRGLVFQCYQVSLQDQFIFLQQSWVNAADFPNPGTGQDPIIGSGGAVTVPAMPSGPQLQFGGFVETEGSVFALTLSIAALTAMAVAQPLSGLGVP